MQIIQNRRHFLAGAASVGAAGLLGTSTPAWAEAPPETTTIRLPAIPAACQATFYLAEELLYEEGFTDVQYVPATVVSAGMVADGTVDFSGEAPVDYLFLMDAGRPLTVLAGIHVGCMELRANDSIQRISDLRGKRVAISGVGAADQLLVGAMAAYVGLDPVEINWVADPSVSQVDLFTSGKVDAFIGGPPDPKQPCARDVGHVVVNIAHDRPWSDYLCCTVAANTDFVRNNPAATKRALRALLRASDICHEQPERAVQRLAERGFAKDCSRIVLTDARYGVWREYDPEDAVRFYALRLNEAGMIKKTPNEIVAGFTDWRFVNELKREMKT